jgi:hypothetical protein
MSGQGYKLSKAIRRIALLVSSVLVMGGCGYTTRAFINNQYKTIYVSPFVNKIDITQESDASSRYKIYRPLLETDITKATIDRFILDGNLRISRQENADLILKGALMEYRRDALRYISDDVVEEYRISLRVDLGLSDQQGKLIWEEKGLIGDYSYFVSGPNAKSESTAIDEAIKDISRRIVDGVVEQW